MENCPFIDDFPIKTSIYKGKSSINGQFSMAMLNNQRVYIYPHRASARPPPSGTPSAPSPAQASDDQSVESSWAKAPRC